MTEKHVYRLALYGAISSGKTCILSALSLPRFPHPDGFTCTWVENVPGHAPPTGDAEQDKTDDPFQSGRRWLIEQRNLLKNGEVPRPNQNRELMSFRFDFGAPEDGTRQIELIDYSGELINMPASDLAAKLRDHMRHCDGLLVLAEAPRNDGASAVLSEELHKLGSAFRELLNERDGATVQNWPIAVLFNKWDRRSDASHFSHAEAQAQLDQFLHQSPPPPHVEILNIIRNAVGHENVACFPVSAFGAHRLRSDGAEVPVLHDGRLQSFGLEDGFIWAARRADALRVDQLEAAANSASWWAFPQLFFGLPEPELTKEPSDWKRRLLGVSAQSGVASAWNLYRRFPKGSELRQRSFKAFAQFSGKLLVQAVLSVVVPVGVLIATGLGIETHFDSKNYRSVLAAQKDPAASVAQLQSGEAWLEKYFTSPNYRHWLSTKTILSRVEAAALLEEFRIRRDDALWKPVNDTQDPQTAEELARKYLSVFPAGRHSSEAAKLLAEAEQRKRELRNREYLEQIALQIDAFAPTADASPARLQAISDAILAVPFPDMRSQSVVNRQTELRSLIAKKQAQIDDAKKHEDSQRFKQNYVSLMQAKNILEAAKLLDGRSVKDAQFEELRSDFARRTPEIIQVKARDAVQDRSWQLARESVRLVNAPTVARFLTAEQIRSVQSLSREIDEAEDLDLYLQIQRYQPNCSDQIQAYLAQAPLKYMKPEVERYRDYLAAMNGPLDLTLSITNIWWDTQYYGYVYNYYNTVTITLLGQTFTLEQKLVSKPGTYTGKIRDIPLTAKLDDTITIDLSCVGIWGLISKGRIPASGRWTGKVRALAAGDTPIDLKGDGFTNKAYLRLYGIPQEPPLPNWTRR